MNTYKPTPTGQWVRTSERVPTDTHTRMAVYSELKETVPRCYDVHGKQWYVYPQFQKVQPPRYWLDHPDPPKIDLEEEAFREAMVRLQIHSRPLDDDDLRKFWQAGVRFGKGERG